MTDYGVCLRNLARDGPPEAVARRARPRVLIARRPVFHLYFQALLHVNSGTSLESRFLLLGFRHRIFRHQRELQGGEQEGQGDNTEDLEAYPEVRALGAPDDLVEHSEREEEQRPTQRQLA